MKRNWIAALTAIGLATGQLTVAMMPVQAVAAEAPDVAVMSEAGAKNAAEKMGVSLSEAIEKKYITSTSAGYLVTAEGAAALEAASGVAVVGVTAGVSALQITALVAAALGFVFVAADSFDDDATPVATTTTGTTGTGGTSGT